MLYMPEGYWHYIKYLTPGFFYEFTLFYSKHYQLIQSGLYCFNHRPFDILMRKFRDQKWIDDQNEKAIPNTHETLLKETC